MIEKRLLKPAQFYLLIEATREPATASELIARCHGQATKHGSITFTGTTFRAQLPALIEQGFLVKVSGERPATYALTENGEAYLLAHHFPFGRRTA